MKLKTIICLTLAVILAASCLTGCRGIEDPVSASDPATTKEPQVKPEEPVPAVPLSAVINAKALGFSAFDNQLVEYLKQAGRADENFTVSPLSFKAALTMAALGAEGETQAQLLEALGFKNVDELRAWYATVLAGVDGFKDYFEAMEKEAAEYASA